MYRNLLGKTEENGNITVYIDGMLSDNTVNIKIVHMRNILTENRQQCKVNTGKKARFTHEY